MLNWLKGLYNGAVGALSAIEKWVVGALNVVYSYFEGLVGQLWNGLQQLADTVSKYIRQVEQYAYGLYLLVYHTIYNLIPQIENWALGELTSYATMPRVCTTGPYHSWNTWGNGYWPG